MQITVVPYSSLVIVDSQPLEMKDLSFPDGVHALYFDTENDTGSVQYVDSTKPLESIAYSAVEPFYTAYCKLKKAKEKEDRRRGKKAAATRETASGVEGVEGVGEIQQYIEVEAADA